MSVHHLYRKAGFGHDLAEALFDDPGIGLFGYHYLEAECLEEGAPEGELLVEGH